MGRVSQAGASFSLLQRASFRAEAARPALACYNSRCANLVDSYPVRVVFVPPLLMVGGWRGVAGEISGEGWQVAAGGQRCLRSDRGAGAAATGAHQVCAGSGPDTRFVGRDGRLPNLGVQARALTRTLGSAQRPFLWPKYCTLTDFSAIWHHDTMVVAWAMSCMTLFVCHVRMTLFVCAVCGSATVFLALDCSYRFMSVRCQQDLQSCRHNICVRRMLVFFGFKSQACGGREPRACSARLMPLLIVFSEEFLTGNPNSDQP